MQKSVSEAEERPVQEHFASAMPDDGGPTAEGRGLRVHCLSIIGQVEGHYLLGGGQKATRYEHLLPQLMEAEMDDRLDGLLILLNALLVAAKQEKKIFNEDETSGKENHNA